MTKIKRKVYNQIKKDYLAKTSILSVLYRKYHKNYDIDKFQFYQIIEKIRAEENIPQKTVKKTKRMSNPFSFHDKHPDSYGELSDIVS